MANDLEIGRAGWKAGANVRDMDAVNHLATLVGDRPHRIRPAMERFAWMHPDEKTEIVNG